MRNASAIVEAPTAVPSRPRRSRDCGLHPLLPLSARTPGHRPDHSRARRAPGQRLRARLGRMRTGELGFWWRSLGGPPPRAPPLPGPAEADVAIVGAGFTGLWTAYYLKRAQPVAADRGARAQSAGFGASGRNGGWVSGFFSGPARAYERRSGAPALRGAAAARCSRRSTRSAAVLAQARRSRPTSSRAATSTVALDPAQLRAPARAASRGPSATASARTDLRELRRRRAARARARRGARSARASRPTPRACSRPSWCAGWPRAVEELGVTIYERTPVSAIAPRRAETTRGTVARAAGSCARPRATRPALRGPAPGARADEQLDDHHRAARRGGAGRRSAGAGRRCSGDEAHVYVYLQRTADGRIAIGGRGVPYRFGSRTDGRGATAARDGAQPAGASSPRCSRRRADVALDHAWSGVLGRAARLVRLGRRPTPRSGLAWAGGYVGEGVARLEPRGAHAARPDPRRATAS